MEKNKENFSTEFHRAMSTLALVHTPFAHTDRRAVLGDLTLTKTEADAFDWILGDINSFLIELYESLGYGDAPRFPR